MSARANTARAWKKSFLLTVVLLLVGCAKWSSNSSQSITFEKVPAADDREHDKLDNIEGRAAGFRPGQKIVLYTKTEELWWIEPGIERPFTNIQDNAAWKGQVHLGTQYAAMLVDPGYNPDAMRRGPHRNEGAVVMHMVSGCCHGREAWTCADVH
jgi:hypothetical protein